MNFVLLDNVKFKSRKNRILLHTIMFVNAMHFDLSCWPMNQSNTVNQLSTAAINFRVFVFKFRGGLFTRTAELDYARTMYCVLCIV